MAKNTTALKIDADASELNEALAELNYLVMNQLELDVPRNRLKRLLSSRDFAAKLTCVERDNSATTAGELLVFLKPTDFFRGFLVALRAGNIQRYITK